MLTRHKSETIVITAPCGAQLTIMLVDVQGKRVMADGRSARAKARIGIDAPREFIIHREEIQKLIYQEPKQ